MPFKSQSQHRAFRAKESRGEIPKGTSDRWAHHTKNIKSLPERKKQAALVSLDLYLRWLAGQSTGMKQASAVCPLLLKVAESLPQTLSLQRSLELVGLTKLAARVMGQQLIRSMVLKVKEAYMDSNWHEEHKSEKNPLHLAQAAGDFTKRRVAHQAASSGSFVPGKEAGCGGMKKKKPAMGKRADMGMPQTRAKAPDGLGSGGPTGLDGALGGNKKEPNQYLPPNFSQISAPKMVAQQAGQDDPSLLADLGPNTGGLNKISQAAMSGMNVGGLNKTSAGPSVLDPYALAGTAGGAIGGSIMPAGVGTGVGALGGVLAYLARRNNSTEDEAKKLSLMNHLVGGAGIGGLAGGTIGAGVGGAMGNSLGRNVSSGISEYEKYLKSLGPQQPSTGLGKAGAGEWYTNPALLAGAGGLGAMGIGELLHGGDDDKKTNPWWRRIGYGVGGAGLGALLAHYLGQKGGTPGLPQIGSVTPRPNFPRPSQFPQDDPVSALDALQPNPMPPAPSAIGSPEPVVPRTVGNLSASDPGAGAGGNVSAHDPLRPLDALNSFIPPDGILGQYLKSGPARSSRPLPQLGSDQPSGVGGGIDLTGQAAHAPAAAKSVANAKALARKRQGLPPTMVPPGPSLGGIGF